MDPDAALDELLAIIDRIQTLGIHLSSRALPQDIHRLINLIDALDSWLTAGGLLPDRWIPAYRRPT